MVSFKYPEGLAAPELCFRQIKEFSMLYLKRLSIWVFEPGLLYVFPVLVLIHVGATRYYGCNILLVNTYASAFFQVVGGFLVIVAINSNLNILSRSSIKRAIIGWIKRFPLKRKVVNVKLSV